MSSPYTGYLSDVLYWFEDTFRDEHPVAKRRFGLGQKITSLSINRDYERVYTIGDRRFKAHIPKRFNGTFNVEAFLSDPYVFGFVLQPDANFENFTVPTKLRSGYAEVFMGYPGGTSFNVVKLKGIVADRLELSISSNNLVKFTLSTKFSDIDTTGTVSSLPAWTPDTWDSNNNVEVFGNVGRAVAVFHSATVTVGSYSFQITDFSLRLDTGVEFVYPVGENEGKPETAVLGQFLASGSITFLANTLDVVNDLLSNNEVDSITITLKFIPVASGGELSGAEEKVITITLGGIKKLESTSVRLNTVGMIEQTLDYVASDISVSASGFAVPT